MKKSNLLLPFLGVGPRNCVQLDRPGAQGGERAACRAIKLFAFPSD